MPESRRIIGRWRITEMDNRDQEAVDLVKPGFIEFDEDGLGELGFIAVAGELDCRDADRDGRPGVEFSWQGSDEGDEVSGRGWAALNNKPPGCGANSDARGLGFEPHADFAKAAGHLGEWDGVCDLEFGRDGMPMYIEALMTTRGASCARSARTSATATSITWWDCGPDGTGIPIAFGFRSGHSASASARAFVALRC
jgi:hypothetical protein